MYLVILTALGVLAFSSINVADQNAYNSSSKSDQEARMEKYNEYTTPYENHKVLDTLVGDWDYKLKWWKSPDTEAGESDGTSKIKWIMGGRFIKNKA